MKRKTIGFYVGAAMVVAGVVLMSQASAATSFVNPAPTGNTLYDAWSPDGHTFYFVGDGGTILKYDGGDWSFMDTPTDYPLYGIHGRSATDIWAVGGNDYAESNSERAVILHYNGSTWTESPPAVFFDTTYPLDDVYAASANDVWAVDDHSPSLFHYDGAKWEIVNPPMMLAGGFFAIHGFSPNDIYACGSYGQIIHYNGTEWELQMQTEDPSTSMSFNLLEDVWGPDAQNVFVCGNLGQIYKRNFQTGDWDEIRAGGGIFEGETLTGISGSSAGDIYFTGYGGFTLHYNGSTFEEVTTANDYWAQYVIRRKADGKYLIAGELGRIDAFSATDRNTLTRLPGHAINIHRAAFTRRLWLAPEYLDVDQGIYTWENAALTEHPVPISSQGRLISFTAFSENDMWLSVMGYGGTDWLLRYDSSQWTEYKPVNYFIMPQILDIVKSGENDYMVIFGGIQGGSAARLLNDEYKEPYPDYYEFLALDQSTDGTVYVVGNGGWIVTYANGTWTKESSGVSVNLTDVAAGIDDIYAVGENRTVIYKSGGGSWQYVSGLTSREENTFERIIHIGNDVFIALLNTPSKYIGGDTAEIYRFSDGGAEKIAGGLSPNLHGLTALSEGRWCAAGLNGTIISGMDLKGDIDMDFNVDIADLVIVLQMMGGIVYDFPHISWDIDRIDIDGNTKFDSAEIEYILQSIAGFR